MNYTIISYYTLNTPYVEVAHKYLMSSLKLLKEIKSDINGVHNLGTWQKNTSFKPTFILKMLEKYQDNVVFVDCDATINEYPSLFENIPEEYSFACYILDRNLHYGKSFSDDYKYELLTGTLFIRNNEKSKEIVRKWVHECSQSKMWEQKILQKILKEYKEEVYQLPLSYCYLFSLPNGLEPIIKCEKPVVTHHQVSRLLKREVSG